MLSLLAQNSTTTTANPEQTQLLEQLRDIHQPDAVAWWPLAAGWWIIIGLVIAIIALLLIKAYLKKRHYRYARLAIKELEQLKSDHEESRWLAKSHHVMRRLSLCYVSENDIGKMDSQEWLTFLQATNSKQQLSDKTLEAFVDLPYKPASATESLDKNAIMDDIMQWAATFPEHAKSWQSNPSTTKEKAHV